MTTKFDIKQFGEDMAESGRILGRCQKAREDADVISDSAHTAAGEHAAAVMSAADRVDRQPEILSGDFLSDEIRAIIAEINRIERSHLHNKTIGGELTRGETVCYCTGILHLRQALERFQAAETFETK